MELGDPTFMALGDPTCMEVVSWFVQSKTNKDGLFKNENYKGSNVVLLKDYMPN